MMEILAFILGMILVYIGLLEYEDMNWFGCSLAIFFMGIAFGIGIFGFAKKNINPDIKIDLPDILVISGIIAIISFIRLLIFKR